MYVREVVLCNPSPPPPASVPLLEPEEGESAQDAFERHTTDPACAGCHLSLDPIGHGLERYDSIGRLRQAYPDGSPVRLEGEIDLDGERRTFLGGAELGRMVAESEDAAQCVVAHAYRFALGRAESTADTCSLHRLDESFAASGQQLPALLLQIVGSDAFRFRRAHEG